MTILATYTSAELLQIIAAIGGLVGAISAAIIGIHNAFAINSVKANQAAISDKVDTAAAVSVASAARVEDLHTQVAGIAATQTEAAKQ